MLWDELRRSENDGFFIYSFANHRVHTRSFLNGQGSLYPEVTVIGLTDGHPQSALSA